ncbi:MAG: small multi-drug export protein [bacterium]|nr:small multi-drug export protein [bacterium]
MEIPFSNLADSAPAIAVGLISALPLFEIRAGIPFGIAFTDLPALVILLMGLIGGALPLAPLYFGLDHLRHDLEHRIPFLHRVIDARLDSARAKLAQNYERYGSIALALFTALPLPLTGLWTATFAAVALKIPFKYAAPAILTGLLIAAILVYGLSAGFEALLS